MAPVSTQHVPVKLNALSAAEEAEAGTMTSRLLPSAFIASSPLRHANFSTSVNHKKI